MTIDGVDGSSALATAAPGRARAAVAEEVRVAMARRRVSGAALARLLHKDSTWMSRRLTGKVAFDIDDLELIARVLDYRLSLPHLDSNQKPTVNSPARAADSLASVLPFRRQRRPYATEV